jgi:hypothetical protein
MAIGVQEFGASFARLLTGQGGNYHGDRVGQPTEKGTLGDYATDKTNNAFYVCLGGTSWLVTSVTPALDATSGDISASAPSDAKAAGSSVKAAKADHVHGREGKQILQAAIVAAPGAFSTVEAYLKAATVLAGSTITAGTLIRCVVEGTISSLQADAVTFNVYVGTAGSTSDTKAFTAAETSAGNESGAAFKAVIELTVRTVTSSGAVYGDLAISNLGAVPVVVGTFATANYVTATKIGVSMLTASTKSIVTVQRATVEVIPA